MSGSLMLGLAGLFLISFLGSGPVPMPLTVTILWLGQFQIPVLVIGVATVGSVLGWLALEGVLRRWVKTCPQMLDRLPSAYRALFLRNTGFWLFVFNALPLPLDFIRFLALLSNYNRVRLTVILAVARLIRNTSLVCLGAALAKHQILLWVVMFGFLLLPLPFGRFLQARSKASLLQAE